MIVHRENTTPDEPIGDADLILRTRSGDTGAFGELWKRHYPSGIAVARSVTSSIDPDDLVQEAYTRIYQAITKGGGPNGSFRAYLFTSIRNTAAAWGRSRRETAIDELDTVADPDSTEHASNEALDRSLTAQAFRSLPSRWQEVLWYTEIEQMKPQEVAPLLGMKAGAVSQLAFRAREGLREAWIQAHLRSATPGSDCQWTIEHLGAYSRGNLGTRDHKRLELHLDECARCMIVAAEAKDVSKRLALVMLPLVLGVAGAGGYLATLQGGGAPIVAMAAMPSSIAGGVLIGDGGTGHAATGVAASGSGASGGSGSAGGTGGASGSGGAFTSMGALVGAGSAALVVAGVVTAAAIIPGLAGANPATSLPSAADSDPSSITTDIAPDSSLGLDQPVVIEAPAEEPPAPPAEEAPAPQPTEQSGTVVTPPSVPVVPVTPPEEAGPTDPTDPTDPTTPTDPTDPTDPVDPVEPAMPTEGPQWSTATIVFTGIQLHYRVPVSGAPGLQVEALIDGATGGGDSITLDEAGAGTIDLRPTARQLWHADTTTVTFRYVFAEGPGPATDTTLLSLAVDSPADVAPVEPAADAAPAPDTAPDTAPVEAALAPAPVEPAPAPAPAPVEPAPAPAPAPVEPAPAAAAAPVETAAALAEPVAAAAEGATIAE